MSPYRIDIAFKAMNKSKTRSTYGHNPDILQKQVERIRDTDFYDTYTELSHHKRDHNGQWCRVTKGQFLESMVS